MYRTLIFFFFFRRYDFILWTFWPSQHTISTYYDPGCSWSNSLFSVSSYHLLYHLPICSLVFLVVVLTSVYTYILILPFSLLAFDVNGQASLIFERTLISGYLITLLQVLEFTGCRIKWEYTSQVGKICKTHRRFLMSACYSSDGLGKIWGTPR
jgi:hypothetical protein